MMLWADPLVRAPLLGATLISIAAAWMGALLYLQRRTLTGEIVSHASYPGLALALLAGWVDDGALVLGGFLSSWITLRWMRSLERRAVPTDSALTFALASSFGIGVLIVSWLQTTLPRTTLLLASFLYGQAATLSDGSVQLYGAVCVLIALGWGLFFPWLRVHLFDREFARSLGMPVEWIDRLLLASVLITVSLGIRSVGVILMTGLLVAPAIAARAWTERLAPFLCIAGAVGALSGASGVLLSIHGAVAWKAYMGIARFTLPTGPLIVLIAALLAFISLMVAPRRGWIARFFRSRSFRKKIAEEHLLKSLWKQEPVPPSRTLQRLVREGWVTQEGALTEDGERRAASVVRLHRLWEVYLTELGVRPDEVHGSAEEMEHVLTRDMEERLTHLLSNPVSDPHHQPIPRRGAKR